jgi:hypothetical protein
MPRKSKVYSRTGHEGPERVSTLFFNLGARWGWWSTPRPSRFTPVKETRYPLHEGLGVPQGTKNFDPTGIHPKQDHYQSEMPAVDTKWACEGQ